MANVAESAAVRPWDRALDLAKKLAAALTEVENGGWYAEVFPEGVQDRPAIYFGSIAAAVELQDSELLMLNVELEKAWQTEKDLLAASYVEGLDQDAQETADDAWEAASDATGLIVEKIEQLPAKSLSGLQVKARAIAWCYNGQGAVDLRCDQDTTDIRLANSIVACLLGTEVPA